MKKLLLLMSVVFFVGTTIIYYSCKKKETKTNQTNETCSDGIKNQGETDIDCGGPCTVCQISTFNNIVIGSGGATGYLFASAQNGQKFKISEGSANQAVIDIVYYLNADDGPTLASPDNTYVNTLTSYGVNNWTTKNQTRFKTYSTLTHTDFENASTRDQLISAANDATSTCFYGVSTDDVIPFKTHSGKSGIIYVNLKEIGYSEMTISIKIEN
jgi:hypothetical protein